jgi:hypothetical protein
VDTKGDVVGNADKFKETSGESVSTVKAMKRPRPGLLEPVDADDDTNVSASVVKGNVDLKKKKGSDIMSSAVMRAARAEAAREFDLGMADANGPWAEYRDDDMELLKTIEMENQAKRTAQVCVKCLFKNKKYIIIQNHFLIKMCRQKLEQRQKMNSMLMPILTEEMSARFYFYIDSD